MNEAPCTVPENFGRNARPFILDLCKRCEKPRFDEIHGPVEKCTEGGTQPRCTEPKAHHGFQLK